MKILSLKELTFSDFSLFKQLKTKTAFLQQV